MLGFMCWNQNLTMVNCLSTVKIIRSWQWWTAVTINSQEVINGNDKCLRPHHNPTAFNPRVRRINFWSLKTKIKSDNYVLVIYSFYVEIKQVILVLLGILKLSFNHSININFKNTVLVNLVFKKSSSNPYLLVV